MFMIYQLLRVGALTNVFCDVVYDTFECLKYGLWGQDAMASLL